MIPMGVGQRLLALATRDLTPPGSTARNVWGVISLVLLLTTLAGLVWLAWTLR